MGMEEKLQDREREVEALVVLLNEEKRDTGEAITEQCSQRKEVH